MFTRKLFLRPKKSAKSNSVLKNCTLYIFKDQYDKNENQIKVHTKLQETVLTEAKTTLGTLFTLFIVNAFYRPTYFPTVI